MPPLSLPTPCPCKKKCKITIIRNSSLSQMAALPEFQVFKRCHLSSYFPISLRYKRDIFSLNSNLLSISKVCPYESLHFNVQIQNQRMAWKSMSHQPLKSTIIKYVETPPFLIHRFLVTTAPQETWQWPSLASPIHSNCPNPHELARVSPSASSENLKVII